MALLLDFRLRGSQYNAEYQWQIEELIAHRAWEGQSQSAEVLGVSDSYALGTGCAAAVPASQPRAKSCREQSQQSALRFAG